jgi:hypothetical protein
MPQSFSQPRQGSVSRRMTQGKSPGKNGPHPLLFPLPRSPCGPKPLGGGPAGEGEGGGGRTRHPSADGLAYTAHFGYRAPEGCSRWVRLKALANRAKSGSVDFSRRLSRRTAIKKYRSKRKRRRSFGTAVEYGRVAIIATEKTLSAEPAVRAAELPLKRIWAVAAQER